MEAEKPAPKNKRGKKTGKGSVRNLHPYRRPSPCHCYAHFREKGGNGK